MVLTGVAGGGERASAGRGVLTELVPGVEITLSSYYFFELRELDEVTGKESDFYTWDKFRQDSSHSALGPRGDSAEDDRGAHHFGGLSVSYGGACLPVATDLRAIEGVSPRGVEWGVAPGASEYVGHVGVLPDLLPRGR
ncbi:MAG: hypothetical protein JWP56_3149 [Aeromicrobium sp.]|nr:hypothetical protein [Aeromicrobium sp.]